MYRSLRFDKATSAALIFLLLVSFAAFLKFQYAKPIGGADLGRLYLAGATEIVRNQSYPVLQRPPGYSFLLAGLGWLTSITGKETNRFARDLGNPEALDVSGDFLNPSYLRIVLLVQILFWLFTIYSVITLFHLIHAQEYVKYALLAFSVPALWMFVGYVHDAVLTQFFLSIGLCYFFLSLYGGLPTKALVGAAVCFSLAGLTRSTFQLLPFFFAICLSIPVLRMFGRKGLLKLATVFVIPAIILLGGWSFRNYQKVRTFSTSSAMGPSLCSRTARFMERASSNFPDVMPSLVAIRDEQGRLWGAKAIKYLVVERGMSYTEASQLLAKINFVAIAHAPFLYLNEVARSLITFHLPHAPRGMSSIRTVSLALDAILIAAFLISTVLWCSAHILGWISPSFRRLRWSDKDTLILGAMSLYWYTAAVTSAVDFGRPEHRAPVQFLLPLVILVVVSRLGIAVRRSTETIRSKPQSSFSHQDLV